MSAVVAVNGLLAHGEPQGEPGLSDVPYFPARENSSSLFSRRVAPGGFSRSARSAESIVLNVYPGMMEIGVKLRPALDDGRAIESDGLPEDSVSSDSHPDDRDIQKAKRGKVTGFSKKSQNNLRKYMNKVAGLDRAVFVTMTYPNEFPASSKRWKRDVKVFKARFDREYSQAGGIWRMELKQRKSGSNKGMVAPHFHLLLVGIDDLKAFRDWLSVVWFEVVGSLDQKHLKAGTNAVRVQNQRHAMWYVSKYISKNEDDFPVGFDGQPLPVGRFWGQIGSVDTVPVFSIKLDFKQLVALRRLASGWLRGSAVRAAAAGKNKSAASSRRFSAVIKRGKLGFAMFGWGVDDLDVIEGAVSGQALRCIGFDFDLEYLVRDAVALGAVLPGR